MSKLSRTLFFGIALIVLLGLGAEVHAQAATDVDCSGCVDRSDIASQAISSSKIKGQAVLRSKIKNNAVNASKLANGSVTSAKIQDSAVTADKIAADAVGVTQIDPDQVQMRVGGSCAVGSFVALIAEDGSVTCGAGSDFRSNTHYGESAFASNTIGNYNTANGYEALFSNTTGGNNVASGNRALFSNITGGKNTAIGSGALYANINGIFNTASGAAALSANTAGDFNTASGVVALNNNTTGSFNTASGFDAAFQNTTGEKNTAIGYSSLFLNTTGSRNIAIGNIAGFNLTTGDENIVIGNPGVADEGLTTRIGFSQTRAFIAGVRGTTTDNSDGVNVMIDSNGQLGTVSSSRRYKQDINDMGQASNRMLQLRPVTFRYKEAYENGEQPLDYGLIAEEVAEVFPELVVFNEKGQPETVKYRLLSSLLLNEVQKQQRVIEGQAQKLAHLDDILTRLKRLEAAFGSNVVVTVD